MKKKSWIFIMEKMKKATKVKQMNKKIKLYIRKRDIKMFKTIKIIKKKK
jgi:hypothetical protein